MTPENSSPNPYGAPVRFLLRPEYLLPGLSILFVIGFWIWFFFLRTSSPDADKNAIQGRAIGEILAVCNAVIPPDDPVTQFQPRDITTRAALPSDGVSPFVSILEVKKNGLVCQWDGVNPAQVTRVGR